MKVPSLRLPVLVGLIAVAALASFIVSCATVNRVVVAPPMIPGAKYVGMETCGTCHEKEVKEFKFAEHSKIQLREATEKDEVKDLGCEACHGPGSLHVDAGGKKDLILKGGDTCFQCHLDTKVQFNLQYHHPVKEGRMTCTACHNPHGHDIQSTKRMPGRAGNDQVCAQCHREQARHRVFEHEALREGCTICHSPHGSINPKLLTERDNNLCLKCHAQVATPGAPGTVYIGKHPHAGFAPNGPLQQGTCFSAGCHTAVHGSDVNSHLRY